MHAIILPRAASPAPQSYPEPRIAHEIELLTKLAASRHDDLKFADAKAGALLTLAVAIAVGCLGVFLKKETQWPAHEHLCIFINVFIGIGGISACIALYCSTWALKPRVEIAESPLLNPEVLGWAAGKFRTKPAKDEVTDKLGAPYGAALEGLKDLEGNPDPKRRGEEYLKSLDFLNHPTSLCLADHCVRMARTAFVKYGYIHVACWYVVAEVLAFAFAGGLLVFLRCGCAS